MNTISHLSQRERDTLTIFETKIEYTISVDVNDILTLVIDTLFVCCYIDFSRQHVRLIFTISDNIESSSIFLFQFFVALLL
jgi:hypothetical protein